MGASRNLRSLNKLKLNSNRKVAQQSGQDFKNVALPAALLLLHGFRLTLNVVVQQRRDAIAPLLPSSCQKGSIYAASLRIAAQTLELLNWHLVIEAVRIAVNVLLHVSLCLWSKLFLARSSTGMIFLQTTNLSFDWRY